MRKYNRLNKIARKDLANTREEIRVCYPNAFKSLERGSVQEIVFLAYYAVARRVTGDLHNWNISKNGGLWVAIQVPTYVSWGLEYSDDSWWVSPRIFRIAREKSLAVLYREVRNDILNSWNKEEECLLPF